MVCATQTRHERQPARIHTQHYGIVIGLACNHLLLSRRGGRRTLSPPTNIFGLLYQGNGSALALTTVSAGSVLVAPVAYREPVGTATLNTIRSPFGTLMELANRHDLKTLHELFWQSPSALLLAKTRSRLQATATLTD